MNQQPIILRRALWPERGKKCQSCGRGSKALLHFWVVAEFVDKGRLLCYECAVLTLAGIGKAGVKFIIQESTTYELGMELEAVKMGSA